jgi:hypothetical protein
MSASVKVAGELSCGLPSASWCLPEVVMMEPAQHRARRDLPADQPHIWPLRPARYALLDALVWAGVIEVSHILFHSSVQVSFSQDQEVVEALSPQTAWKALTGGAYLRYVGPRCSIRCPQHLDSCSHPCERSSILVVVVADEESRSFTIRCGFPQSLSSPLICRVPRDTKMDHSARAEFDDHASTTDTNTVRKRISHVCRKSHAHISLAWWRRKVVQVCFGARDSRSSLMYFC